ncbi:MAG: 30S ribosomal protein S13 [Planctomycetota bacterium]
MPRLIGVDIPAEKEIFIALTYIYGIGRPTSLRIVRETGINPRTRARDLTEEETTRIAGYIEKNCVVEGPLRRQVAVNIQRLKEIGCYRGIRHRRGLPVRGQRTQSNARTRKGPRKTVAGKKSVKTK